jgi:hypothetical protein
VRPLGTSPVPLASTAKMSRCLPKSPRRILAPSGGANAARGAADISLMTAFLRRPVSLIGALAIGLCAVVLGTGAGVGLTATVFHDSLAGATGPQGIPGEQGQEGEQGEHGVRGQRGPKGATGATGASAPVDTYIEGDQGYGGEEFDGMAQLNDGSDYLANSVDDLNCADIADTDFPTPPTDEDGLDGDGDGIACEI